MERGDDGVFVNERGIVEEPFNVPFCLGDGSGGGTLITKISTIHNYSGLELVRHIPTTSHLLGKFQVSARSCG